MNLQFLQHGVNFANEKVVSAEQNFSTDTTLQSQAWERGVPTGREKRRDQGRSRG